MVCVVRVDAEEELVAKPEEASIQVGWLEVFAFHPVVGAPVEVDQVHRSDDGSWEEQQEEPRQPEQSCPTRDEHDVRRVTDVGTNSFAASVLVRVTVEIEKVLLQLTLDIDERVKVRLPIAADVRMRVALEVVGVLVMAQMDDFP